MSQKYKFAKCRKTPLYTVAYRRPLVPSSGTTPYKDRTSGLKRLGQAWEIKKNNVYSLTGLDYM